MRHIDALSAHFYHPGVLEHAPRGGAAVGLFLETVHSLAIVTLIGAKRNAPALNKVLKVLAPPNTRLWLVLQLGDRLPHNISQ